MNFRAICTDIDGTLLTAQRQLSSKTIEVFRRLPAGVPVILASSRMPSAMTHLQHELGIAGHPLVCYNGGYALRHKNGKLSLFTSVDIDLNTCAAILACAEGTSIHMSLYNEDEWHAPALDYWTDREQRITKVNARIADARTVLDKWSQNKKGAHKIMCMGPEAEIDLLEQTLNDKFAARIHIYRSRPTYLELAPRSVSKATALKLVLESEYGLGPADVIAFGDNYNDIDMLQTAGLGVAVGNAREEVKAVARELTANSVDDGVALAIQKYF